MKAILFSVFSLFGLNATIAQLAIINDQDGYTNVRKGPSSKDEIVSRIFDGEIFEFEAGSDWYSVYYSEQLNRLEDYKRTYYQQHGFNSDEVYIEGYMHKSRILMLGNLESIVKAERTEDFVLLKNDSIKITFTIIDFKKENHTISKQKDGDYFVELIDGKSPFGVDGGMPTREITEVKIWWNGKQIDFPKAEYENMFQPNYRGIDLVKHRDYVYLLMLGNSDGAGYYYCTWIFKNGQFLKTFVSTL